MVLSSEGLSSAPEMFSNPQPPPTQCQEPLWKAECPSLKDGHIFPKPVTILGYTAREELGWLTR